MGALLSTRPQPTLYVAKPLPILPPVVVPSDLDLSLRGPRCTVCLEYDMEFPRATPTLGCTHKIDVCLSCLRSYVTSGIEGALSLRCPTIGCIGQLDVEEIQTWIGESHRQEFERFCEMKVRYFLQKEQGLVWCRAPGCGSGQIHDGGAAYPIVTCQTCSARTCFIHDSIWHEGQTCDEYTRELAARAKAAPIQARATKKSESWIKSHTKLCPGEGCNRPIQKNRGCDHMTCHKPAGCGHEFCWRCLAPYAAIREGGNGKHNPGCKYYSSK